MKKLMMLLIGIAMLTIMAGCTQGEEVEAVKFAKPGEILSQIEGKESFAFVIGDEDCPACQQYTKKALTEMTTKSDVTLQFIELKGIEERKEEFEDIENLIIDHLDGQFEATPTTYFIVDGEFKEAVIGAIPYKELLETYEKHIGKLTEK